jgi:plastocyanin
MVFGVVASGCGGDSPEATTGQSQVFGYDDVFAPDIIEVDLGTEIEWRMEGENPHNVFASDGSWESPLTMERGQTFSRTFTESRVYPYFCTFHGTPGGDGMAGYVIVGDVPDYEKPRPDDTETVEAWTGNTITVPTDYDTIRGAVDAAAPGDMVYNEAVTVRTPSLTIRGADRNATILDGEFERSNGLHVVADAVAIENMTARNFEVNGFYWTGVTGYRASYLTAHNNGDYGIYAFDSVDRLFEYSYGSGNRDSAFYIGQCYPCNAVVTDVVSEANGLGF